MTLFIKMKRKLDLQDTFKIPILKNNKMKKNLIAILFGVLFSSSLFSQDGKIIKADKYYDGYSYVEAINKYESLAEKPIEVKRKLADSYLKIGDPVHAEVYYREVANDVNKKPEDVYNYASVLRINKKYDMADEWMTQFHHLSPADLRGIQNNMSRGKYKELLSSDGMFIIRNLATNTAQEDFGTSFYKDQVVFSSSRTGSKAIKREWNWNKLPFLDLYVADKEANFDMKNLKQFRKKENKKYHEGPAAFNTSGDYMVFTRNNYDGKSSEDIVKLQMFSSTKINGNWSEPLAMPFNSKEYSVGHATLSADGKTMYFASDMPGGKGGVDIYKSSRNDNGSWSQPINMGDKINTEGNEMFPFIHQDGMLFFASNGHPGLGGLDIFMSSLDSEGKVSKLQNIGAPINSNKDDFAFIINEGQTNGYFSSNKDGGKGDDDIYTFRMTKPFEVGKVIRGIAKTPKGEILADTEVILLDINGQGLGMAITGDDGAYEFTVDPDANFVLIGSKEDYFDGDNTADTHTDESVIYADLVLEKDPGVSLYCVVTEKGTNTPLNGVKVTLIDNKNQGVENYTTAATGDFRKPLQDVKLQDNITYNLTFEKEGYMSKTVTYNKKITKPGQYNVHADLDISLNKLEAGVNLADLIDINPIYFDYNKFNIRPDAKVELNKIVKVMTDYPTMEIELGSHTDCRGKKSYNEWLSTERAKASAKYIKSKITNPSRIYGKGYGEYRLINKCECEGSKKVPCTDEEHQENRRTEFKIISMGGANVKNNSPDSFNK